MSYNTAFRPQIYSYQSRSRARQYPRQVRTSIPGAGFAVRELVWGDQPIDLGGLGAVGGNFRWWELTPAFWAQAERVGFDDLPRPLRDPAEAAGGPVFLRVQYRPDGLSLVVWYRGMFGGSAADGEGNFYPVPADKVASITQALNALQALKLPTLSSAEVDARAPNDMTLRRSKQDLVDAPRTTSQATASFAPTARTPANRTVFYVGVGVGVAALLGGGYYFWKHGKRA